MKKQLLIGALSFAAILFVNSNVKAQTANVTINLSDVVSVDPTQSTAGNAAGDVGFTYPTEASYRAAQNYAKNKHLVVTSTKGFNVTVKAAGIAGATATAFDGPGAAEIPFDVMVVKVLGTSTLAGTPTLANVTLSDTAQPLITSAGIGSVQEVNIDYSISAEKASSTDILGKPAGDYKGTVIYTITSL